jgi:hypothetical protein
LSLFDKVIRGVVNKKPDRSRRGLIPQLKEDIDPSSIPNSRVGNHLTHRVGNTMGFRSVAAPRGVRCGSSVSSRGLMGLGTPPMGFGTP